MKHKSFVVVIAAFCFGCSSSNDTTTAIPNDSADTTIEFGEPDADGNSDLAQMSYPVVRDLSRKLLTGKYLNTYFDVDELVDQLLYDAVGGVDAIQTGAVAEDTLQAPFACPDGGTVSVSISDRNGPAATFSASFSDCHIGERIFKGNLVRDGDYHAIGGGSSQTLALIFDALTINETGQGQLLISGTVSRDRSDTTPEMLTQGQRGNCVLDSSNVHLVESSSISSAILEWEGTEGSVTISESNYQRNDDQRHDATSDEATCPITHIASENGSASLAFSNYGSAATDGAATIATAISTELTKVANSHTASQKSTLPDGSSVELTALADTDGKVQVDVFADDVASSFVDNYRFVSEDFEL